MVSAEGYDAKLLATRDFPVSRFAWTSASLLKGLETIGVVSSFPVVESLAGDAEVPARLRGIAGLVVVIHPLESLFRLFGETW